MSRRDLPPSAIGLLTRPGLWPFCLAVTVALVRARLRLRRVRAAEFLRAVPPTETTPSDALPGPVARIGWAVPRIAKAMPFRADCLVQAMAAEALLARRGYASEICIGARKTQGGVAAHAWLTHEGRVVTGGEIGGYRRFLSEPV